MTVNTINTTRILHEAHPDGLLNSYKHFEIMKEKIDLEKIELIQDKLLVHSLCLSVDPSI
ncbi:hypothetical protein K502DRAFT_326539 [Neoconidiobolus thromboides FSU 785]|nr:hypothetical protein K502DRAFT_326539 [Neoconidiobolus thromboides FSU 785]